MVRYMRVYGLLDEALIEILQRIGYEETKKFGDLYPYLRQGRASLTARLLYLNKKGFIIIEQTPEGETFRMTYKGFKELQKSLIMKSRNEGTVFRLRLKLGPLPEEMDEYLEKK